MKFTILPLVLLLVTATLHGQDTKQKRPGHFGLSYSGIGIIQDNWDPSNMRYEGGTYGYEQYSEKMFYTIGFNYLKPISSWIDIETGLEYSRKLGQLKTIFFDDAITKKANTTMASIPLTLRANFLRFFFINGGLLTDFDLGGYESARYQSGIGPVLGLGIKYGFKYGGQIFINPYFKRRAVISFSENEDRMKMEEVGIRVGVYFNTRKKIE